MPEPVPSSAGALSSVERRLLFVLLSALSVACFLRPGFFYYWDEWTNLEQIARMPFERYVLRPDCEHFMPVHKFLYASLIFLVGENYTVLVLVNCIVLAAVGYVLAMFLTEMGVSVGLASLVSVLYVTNFANWEVATWAWQLQIALAALFGLSAFRLHLRADGAEPRQVVLAGICGLLAAWSQGAGFMVPVCLAVFIALGGWRRWPAAYAVGLLVVQLSVYLATKLQTGPTVLTALREGQGVGERVRLLADWMVFGSAMGFYGPLRYALGAVEASTRFYSAAAIGLVFVAVTLAGLASTRWREAAAKLVVFQVLTFLGVGFARMVGNPTAGYSFRYQTYALWPILSLLAFAAQALLERSPARRPLLTAVLAVLLLIGIGENVRHAVARMPELAISRGVRVRQEYLRIKRRLTASMPGPAPNGLLSSGVHPHFQYEELARVLGLLDPSVRDLLPGTFAPVTYVGQRQSNRPWGEIFGARQAVQTFVVDERGILAAIGLAVATYQHESVADLEISIVDPQGNVLVRERVRGSEVYDNMWLTLLPPPVLLAPGVPYRLQVASTARDPAHAVTIWMTTDGASFAAGGTTAADETAGDLAFQIGYVPVGTSPPSP